MASPGLAHDSRIPVEIQNLSLKEWLAVCERAEGACARRFREIAGQADPKDQSLLDFLRNLVSEEEGHLADVRRFGEKVQGPGVWRLDDALLEYVLKHHFPSFSQGFGEGNLSRDVALYLAECVERESSRFYRDLSAGAPDPAARDFFRKAAEGEESHLKCIQTTLL
jgi:rubrerythrin